jgi:hypothetical protein
MKICSMEVELPYQHTYINGMNITFASYETHI